MKRRYSLFVLGASAVLLGASLATHASNDYYTKAEIDAIFCVPAKLKRYCDNGDGTVTDTRTNLVWLKKTDCFGYYGYQDWQPALDSAATLTNGTCNLSDGSQAGYWRLPLVGEWQAMVDTGFSGPALSNAAGTGRWKEGDAFTGVGSTYYWSSSSDVNDLNFAWDVNLLNGVVQTAGKASSGVVWPVRGGQ